MVMIVIQVEIMVAVVAVVVAVVIAVSTILAVMSKIAYGPCGSQQHMTGKIAPFRCSSEVDAHFLVIFAVGQIPGARDRPQSDQGRQGNRYCMMLILERDLQNKDLD